MRDLGFREVEPGDVERDGNQVPDHHVIIVRIKDCEVTQDADGRRTYHPQGVKQAVQINYGATNYGYGETKQQNRSKWGYDENGGPKLYNYYWTTPFYIVHKAQVYRGYIHHFDQPPMSWRLEHADQDSPHFKRGVAEVNEDPPWTRDRAAWETLTELARVEYLAGRERARNERSVV